MFLLTRKCLPVRCSSASQPLLFKYLLVFKLGICCWKGQKSWSSALQVYMQQMQIADLQGFVSTHHHITKCFPAFLTNLSPTLWDQSEGEGVTRILHSNFPGSSWDQPAVLWSMAHEPGTLKILIQITSFVLPDICYGSTCNIFLVFPLKYINRCECEKQTTSLRLLLLDKDSVWV